jgi:hypothetical protein
MTYLRKRKSRLSFITNSTARYRGREREIVMEVFPEYARVRLLGTRTRYEVTWRAVFDLAAEIQVRRDRERKREERRAGTRESSTTYEYR